MGIIYCLIAVCLIFLDKFITFLTILAVGEKYPNRDKFSVEKNPLALYFMRSFGLGVGSLCYGIFSFFSFFFCVWLLDFIFEWETGFVIISLIYCVVLLNNLKWFIKYSR